MRLSKSTWPTPGDSEPSRAEQQLRAAARQQEAVARLGQHALAGAPLADLLQTATTLVTRGLDVEFSDLLELKAERGCLLLRAGEGWREGCVGRTLVPADATGLAGYALTAPGPLVVEDLPSETRFTGPAHAVDHGIVSGLSVVVQGRDRPWGVLGGYSAHRRDFAAPDILFVQALAHVLATAIERARAEDAMRASEEHYRSLIENASDIVTIVGDDGILRYTSPSVQRLLGYGASELLGRSAFELIHPDDLADVIEALGNAIERPGTPQRATFRFKHVDGSWRVLESIGQAKLDRPNAYTVVVNSRDVSERVRQEHALRASKHRLRTVVAGAPVVLFALDRDGTFTMAEGKGLQALGVRPGQLVGRSFFELLAGLPQALAELKRALAGEAFTSTVEIFGFEFEAWYSPVRERDGTVSGVVGVATDITQRRRAEAALRRSDEATRALVQHAPFGIYRATPDGALLAVNPALVQMLGYGSEAELMRTHLDRDVFVDPQARSQYVARLNSDPRPAEAQVAWRRQDGDTVMVRLYGRAVRHDDGRIECHEVFAEDVSEQRSLEEQLRQSQKMEAIGQLTGGIAHDFNNLLTIILANAELLAKELPAGSSDGQASVRDIRSATLSGRLMVNQLLGFARRSSLTLEPVHLGHTVTELAGVLRRVLPEDIELLVFADEDLPEVHADPTAVEQILLNIVNNARDAMPDGGVLRLETSCTWISEAQRAILGPGAASEYVCVAADDTGAGMDEATRQRVFEPFFTTKPLGKGTGLGLATVYGLVKQHGGFAHIDSAPGAGTRVRIYFPVAAEGVDVPAAGDAGAAPVAGGSETILVLEDQAQLRRAAVHILEQAGYRVLAAADGEEALQLLRTHPDPIHLVFSDLVMARLGGREVYETARSEGRTTPFLFTSGYAGFGRRGDEPLDPALPFLPKPWTSAALLARVRQVLDEEAQRGGKLPR
ncbi:MAG TPA: PAS domain S-box protein [Gemmatimonadales bacterium]|nr:PAS domain S-box protein [Gemmatimonadales bacterium]